MNTTERKPQFRKPTLAESVLVISAMAIFVCVGYVMFKFGVEMMLIMSAVFAALMSLRLGFKWADIEHAICHKTVKVLPALYIMFTVGIVIATFIFSGAIPMLIYYGLQIITPAMLLPCCFLICAILSVATGTSWGSAGTAGLALLGVAIGLGFPIPVTVGAIVAGSVFGDKMSPLSDTTNLAALSSGVNLYSHIRSMMWTTIPASLIALAVYAVVGFKFAGEYQVPESLSAMLQSLDTIYHWNILLLLPFVIIVAGALTKKPTIPVMFVSSAVAMLLGIVFQGFSIKDGFVACLTGFDINMVKTVGFDVSAISSDVLRLIHRGGLRSMFNTVLIVLCAYSFAGVAEEAGYLDTILNSFVHKLTTPGITVFSAVIVGTVLTFIGGSSYIPIIMLGELYQKPYLKQKLDLSNLSRTCEDTGTMLISIVPYGTSGTYYLGIFGISALVYGPWVIPAFICPILAIVYGFTGFGMKKLTPEQAQKQLDELDA